MSEYELSKAQKEVLKEFKTADDERLGASSLVASYKYVKGTDAPNLKFEEGYSSQKALREASEGDHSDLLENGFIEKTAHEAPVGGTYDTTESKFRLTLKGVKKIHTDVEEYKLTTAKSFSFRNTDVLDDGKYPPGTLVVARHGNGDTKTQRGDTDYQFVATQVDIPDYVPHRSLALMEYYMAAPLGKEFVFRIIWQDINQDEDQKIADYKALGVVDKEIADEYNPESSITTSKTLVQELERYY